MATRKIWWLEKPVIIRQMPNTCFQFKQFIIHQDRCAMKVTTDACLFGAALPHIPFQDRKTITALDIGTGSGLLALMYAQKNPDAIIDAIEIDEPSARQAKENVSLSPWNNRITIIHGDARSHVFAGKYDYIFSNPPFYENELKTFDNRKNAALHGEALSLSELFGIISANLAADGCFSLLLPYKRRNEIPLLLQKNGLAAERLVLVRPSLRHQPFRIMLTGKRMENANGEPEVHDMAIWEREQRYTPEFVHLLKEYYSVL